MKNKKYIVATIKSWNINNFYKLKERDIDNYWYLIKDKAELNYENVRKISPKYIFFPHWSWIIPKEIYENFACIVFHMTDLPFGRGGSPLQNLISRGIYKTKISAIRVVKELDAGDIYCQKPLSLKSGSAAEIFKKASDIIYNKMIPFIIKNKPIPKKQKGKVVVFKRRKPEESDIAGLNDLNKVYDYIRMLDAEGYPRAFIETESLRMEFNKARKRKEKVIAECTIKLKT